MLPEFQVINKKTLFYQADACCTATTTLGSNKLSKLKTKKILQTWDKVKLTCNWISISCLFLLAAPPKGVIFLIIIAFLILINCNVIFVTINNVLQMGFLSDPGKPGVR